MANGDVDITEGSGLKVGSYTISEDAVTRHLQRIVVNDSTGVEVDLEAAVASLASLEASVPALGQTSAASSQSVVTASDMPPPSGGGYSISRDIDLDNSTLTVVKASAGVIYKIRMANFATVPSYVKIYNATSGTIGTGTPIDTICLPAATASDCVVVTESFGPYGLYCSTGICWGASSALADADTGDPGANKVVATMYYA